MILFFLFGTADHIDCQYKSPILKCVTRENSTANIIRWQDPNETCGAFQNFNLFYANSKNGPYQLLKTYTDITTVIDTHKGIVGSQELESTIKLFGPTAGVGFRF